MVEHMTGQACKELHLDPVNPLGRMVPLGVLQEAGDQVGGCGGGGGVGIGRRSKSKP